MRPVFLAVLAALLLLPAPLAAAQSTGGVEGRAVLAGRGECVPAAGSTVLVGETQTVVSDEGTFGVADLVPGVHDVTLSPPPACETATATVEVVGPPEAVQPGVAGPRGLTQTFVVSADPADDGRFSGGRAVSGDSPRALAAAVATLLLELGGVPDVTLLAEAGDAQPLPALALAGAPLLLHRPGALDGARDRLFAQRSDIARVRTAAPATEALRRELQSLLNEFEIHLLRGSAGQGLPVITQPPEERPIGRARR